MYNLSGIQKGIQFGHAALEYANNYGRDEAYKQFIEKHKTFIILDGGGSNEIIERYKEIHNNFGIRCAWFKEPDLNNAYSAVVFLVEERVYAYDPEKHGMRSAREVEFETYLKTFKLAAN